MKPANRGSVLDKKKKRGGHKLKENHQRRVSGGREKSPARGGNGKSEREEGGLGGGR